MEGNEVMDILYTALKNAGGDARINDVTAEGTTKDPKIILTLDAGSDDSYEVWIISKKGIIQGDDVPREG